MRIRNITAANIPPVDRFEIDALSDLVVIAGPNGVGKTRLLSAIIASIRNKRVDNVQLVVEPTNREERLAFSGGSESSGDPQALLDTSNQEQRTKLLGAIQKNRYRRNYRSGLLYYESDRSITNVQPLAYEFEFTDPWEEEVSWNLPFGGLKERWTDTQHSIFKKIHRQTSSIAGRARQLRDAGHRTMNLDFENPLEPFADAFFKLLGPKRLVKADLQAQTLMFEHNGKEHSVAHLSSGEKEVLNIAFDFILRSPSDCIVFFDEPELHLHPELLARLVSTLRSIGERNQFVLISHSPDLISSSLSNTVVFLSPPKIGLNQAVVVGRDNEAAEILHRLGQSIGVIALGRKIVLIEGTDASLDVQTYSYLVNQKFPELVLLPSGGKGSLSSFSAVVDDVLNQSIWGVEFFMLADRDAFPAVQPKRASKRFRTLPRYHLENYFLDADIIASCFKEMELAASCLCIPHKIEEELRNLARETLPYATSLVVAKQFRDSAGNVSLMPKNIDQLDLDGLTSAFRSRATSEACRVSEALGQSQVDQLVNQTYHRLARLLEDESSGWKIEFPGKPVFHKFCGRATIQPGRLSTMYIRAATRFEKNPFAEVLSIFGDFASALAIREFREEYKRN